ncbi:MAG TPA: hypothetical protein VJ044_04260, partial [Candidatus Hodarchaeales archaeon]|nr:hypothetical protein [Candidatus Hodarchaeales archaeon]
MTQSIMPWSQLIKPKDVVGHGKSSDRWFVADLGDIIEGSGSEEYSNPRMFFERTYFSNSLRYMIRMIRESSMGERAGVVIEIRAPFGGGKSHGLLGIYHYIKNGNNCSDLLPELPLPPEVSTNLAVVVGTQLNPSQGRKSGSKIIRT